MATKEKWHSKWWVTGLLLPIIATWVSDWIKEKPLFTTFLSITIWIYNSILYLLNYEIKVWLILASIILIIIVMIFLTNFNNKKTTRVSAYPSWFDYKRDIFKKWLWSWQYQKNPLSGKYEIVNLIPVCQRCDIKMLEEGFSLSYYKCPNCDNMLSANTFYQGWESKQDIEALILNKIEKGLYPNAEQRTL